VSVGVCAVPLKATLAVRLEAGIRAPVHLQEPAVAVALTFALVLVLLSVPEPVLAQAASVHYHSPARRRRAPASKHRIP